MKKLMRSGLAVVLSLGVGQNAFAIGGDFIGNEVPSARAAGQGYTGVAGQNEDPTAAYTNPAAITSLKGTQATLGLHWENIRGDYKDNAGMETKERMTNVIVPNFSMTQSFMDGKLAAGLTSQSPYGLETHWDANSPMRYVATNSVLHMVDISPVIAYQVHPKVSIGAGVDYVNLFDAQLDHQINVSAINTSLGAPSLSPDATGSLRGQAANWGYHAGIVIQPTEQHALGITYRSKENLHVNGNVTIRGMSGAMGAVFGGTDYTTSAHTDLVLPSNVQFGYAFKPNDKWLFEADTAWYHWSEAKDLNVRYTETDPTRLAVLTNFGNGNPTPLTLRDAWSFAAGTNYKVSEKWQVRGGFWYEPHAMPETTFSPAFMDLSRYSVSVGAGYALTQSVTIDAAYSAVFFHNRTINNTVQQNGTGIPEGAIPGVGINGTYKDFANLLALNVTYRFGAAK